MPEAQRCLSTGFCRKHALPRRDRAPCRDDPAALGAPLSRSIPRWMRPQPPYSGRQTLTRARLFSRPFLPHRPSRAPSFPNSIRILAALVPMGADGLDRIEAVARLWRAINGRDVPADARLTSQQRRRLRRMLQAVDGRHEGASYREIAEAIFGAARVADAPWKTSALRDATIDLVKDGLALIAGGYRSLLRRRRRP